MKFAWAGFAAAVVIGIAAVGWAREQLRGSWW